MTKYELENLILENYGVTAEHPFEDDLDTAVFRHASNRKWFAIIMSVPRSKLGINDPSVINIVNFKCDEEVAYSMVQESGIYPAYHMNKRHWISVALDGSVDDSTIEWLLGISFELTFHKKKT